MGRPAWCSGLAGCGSERTALCPSSGPRLSHRAETQDGDDGLLGNARGFDPISNAHNTGIVRHCEHFLKQTSLVFRHGFAFILSLSVWVCLFSFPSFPYQRQSLLLSRRNTEWTFSKFFIFSAICQSLLNCFISSHVAQTLSLTFFTWKHSKDMHGFLHRAKRVWDHLTRFCTTT